MTILALTIFVRFQVSLVLYEERDCDPREKALQRGALQALIAVRAPEMEIGLVPRAAKWRLALRRRISAIIARRCARSLVAMVALADNGAYGMRRLLKDLIIGV